MRNAAQLKGIIKNMSLEKGIKANAILQNYMLEVLLEYIANSKYKKNFILKGGMLISSIVGIANRTTMDIDATVKGISLSEENLSSIFNEIINIKLDERFSFVIKKIEKIREEDEYEGFRLAIESTFETIIVPLKVDISTGDKITPKEINYSFKSLFEDKYIEILAYNIETILAEKFETILSRGILNTRARDFYDVYILLSLRKNDINQIYLKKALDETTQKRGSVDILNESIAIINKIKTNENMKNIWYKYTKKYDYAKEINYEDVIEKVFELNKILFVTCTII